MRGKGCVATARRKWRELLVFGSRKGVMSADILLVLTDLDEPAGRTLLSEDGDRLIWMRFEGSGSEGSSRKYGR